MTRRSEVASLDTLADVENGRAVLTWTKIAAAAGTVLCIQIACTLSDRNVWPFCAYNMFNYHLDDTSEELRVVLHEEDGWSSTPLDPWGVLPLEFFRVVSILEEMYITRTDEIGRANFSQFLLDQLNTTSWRAFDEVAAGYRPRSGHVLVGLDIYLVAVHADYCDPRDRSQVVTARLLHRYNPRDINLKPAQWALQSANDGV